MPTSALTPFYRTAFVTGASTGLGRAFAEMLLREGVRVWGTSRETSRLAELARNHPGGFTPIALDLRDGETAEQTFLAADRSAAFDLVINNAGYGVFGEFHATAFPIWQDQINVMLVNTARLSHAALQAFDRRRRGTLVNVSSLAAEFPLPFQAAYNVAKAGLTALNESLIFETAGTEIVVIDFRPGDYRTDFETSVRQTSTASTPRLSRAWAAFAAMMRSGPPPAHAAHVLRAALLRRKSGTVRTGRFFQARLAPFLARFAPLEWRRRIQARYFDVS